jgi:hypothetical protein
MIRTCPGASMTSSNTRHKSPVALILIDVINDFRLERTYVLNCLLWEALSGLFKR